MCCGRFDRVQRGEKPVKTARSVMGMGKSHPQAGLEAATLSQYFNKFRCCAMLRADFVWFAGAFGDSYVFYEGLDVRWGRRGKTRHR